MKSYHFNIGGGGQPLGMCARVTAKSKKKAVKKLLKVLANRAGDTITIITGADYVNIYLYADEISIFDIDDSETVRL